MDDAIKIQDGVSYSDPTPTTCEWPDSHPGYPCSHGVPLDDEHPRGNFVLYATTGVEFSSTNDERIATTWARQYKGRIVVNERTGERYTWTDAAPVTTFGFTEIVPGTWGWSRS